MKEDIKLMKKCIIKALALNEELTEEELKEIALQFYNEEKEKHTGDEERVR